MKRLTKLIFLFIFMCIFSLTVYGTAEQEKNEEIEIILQQKIKMKDGINLAANIFKPLDLREKLPAIFVFTPYVADEGQKRGAFFAKNGYVYVHVDVRGRGNSQGKFVTFGNDGIDGAQVVEWIAKQPWCNGKVGMRGGSYRGMLQWETLKYFPPHLETIVPSAAAAPGVDVPMPNNIFFSLMSYWLSLTKGKTQNKNLAEDIPYWLEKWYKLYSRHLPFSKLAEITGSDRETLNLFLSHPYVDDFWKSKFFPHQGHKRIKIPILTVTGYFDENQNGALHYYGQHMKYGEKNAEEKHFLVIGPWTHAGTRTPAEKLSNTLVFGKNAVLDMDKLHLEWFNWTMKGMEKPKFLQKRICYYVMGENKWKYCDNLGEMSSHKMVWHLSSSNGKANDIFHSGFLKTTPPGEGETADVFKYDPLEIISRDEYFKRFNNPLALIHQQAAYKEDKLIYHSPPFKNPVEISGVVRARIFIELNVPDTDLVMYLYEITRDGESLPLARDIIRARYRKSLSRPQLVVPGEINEYIFERSNLFSRVIAKGSRLRLIFTCLNSPNFDKNYNSGGVVSEETAKDARTAIIKLYHNKKYPSVIELPMAQPGKKR